MADAPVAAGLPERWVTSRADRFSIGISRTPSRTRQSIEGDGHGGVEGHAVVARRQRLQVGADLVADVAGRRRAVGADDDHVDLAVLHEVAARRCRRSTVWATPWFRSSQAVRLAPWLRGRVSSTQTWTGSAGVVRGVDRGRRGADVDRREPAGVAMGEDVDTAGRAPCPAASAADEREARRRRSPRLIATSSSQISPARGKGLGRALRGRQRSQPRASSARSPSAGSRPSAAWRGAPRRRSATAASEGSALSASQSP